MILTFEGSRPGRANTIGPGVTAPGLLHRLGVCEIGGYVGQALQVAAAHRRSGRLSGIFAVALFTLVHQTASR